jgi:hypothetical protein
MLPAGRAPGIRRAYAEVRGDTVAVTAGRLAAAYERELRVTGVLIVRPAQGGVCPVADRPTAASVQSLG